MSKQDLGSNVDQMKFMGYTMYNLHKIFGLRKHTLTYGQECLCVSGMSSADLAFSGREGDVI